MLKTKVSYQDKKELEQFLKANETNIDKVKLSKNDKGQFKKAYITMKQHIDLS